MYLQNWRRGLKGFFFAIECESEYEVFYSLYNILPVEIVVDVIQWIRLYYALHLHFRIQYNITQYYHSKWVVWYL